MSNSEEKSLTMKNDDETLKVSFKGSVEKQPGMEVDIEMDNEYHPYFQEIAEDVGRVLAKWQSRIAKWESARDSIKEAQDDEDE